MLFVSDLPFIRSVIGVGKKGKGVPYKGTKHGKEGKWVPDTFA